VLFRSIQRHLVDQLAGIEPGHENETGRRLVAAPGFDAGLDLAAGLHSKLADVPELRDTAERLGRNIFDVRHPTETFPVGTGEKRAGKRLLPVGTDCSCGKMYTALAMEKSMLARGMKATFRATGQTGILITGNGIPLDAVIADFMAGSVEYLTPPNDDDHWDLIEGQGSLFHPSFSGVTMALIHGGAPDALVLCHEPTRTHMRGLPEYSLPSLEELQDLALKITQIVNPESRVVGISINTAAMSDAEADEYLQKIEQQMGLPTVDPFRDSADRLAEALI